MQPIDLKAEGYENVITFAEHQPEYQPLPAVEVEPGCVWTTWTLSETERRAIMDGARVELFVWTFGRPLQPVALRIEGGEEGGVAEGGREGVVGGVVGAHQHQRGKRKQQRRNAGTWRFRP